MVVAADLTVAEVLTRRIRLPAVQDMIAPPTDSATANCQPMRITSTTPSSTTRFVEANMKTMAEMKSAPFWNSDLAIAVAA